MTLTQAVDLETSAGAEKDEYVPPRPIYSAVIGQDSDAGESLGGKKGG